MKNQDTKTTSNLEEWQSYLTYCAINGLKAGSGAVLSAYCKKFLKGVRYGK